MIEAKLRQVVEELEEERLSTSGIARRHAATLTPTPQKLVLAAFFRRRDREKALSTSAGEELRTIRQEIRMTLQQAILEGLLNLKVIQVAVVDYGVIPDPKTGWRYFLIDGENYACWKCGSKVSVRLVSEEPVVVVEANCPGCNATVVIPDCSYN